MLYRARKQAAPVILILLSTGRESNKWAVMRILFGLIAASRYLVFFFNLDVFLHILYLLCLYCQDI